MMTPNELTDAITTLKGGESLVYYTGDLAANRYISKEDICEEGNQHVAVKKRAIASLGNTTYRLAEVEALGFLTQRRVEYAVFNYIFTKRAQPEKQNRRLPWKLQG